MHKILITYLTIGIFFLVGCYPQVLYVHKEPGAELKQYAVIQIPDFKQTDSEWVPPDSSKLIPNMIVESLLKSNKFKVLDRSTDPLDEHIDVLLVKGVVTGYIKGCKYCEWAFMGISDKGKGSTSVWVQLIDKATGEVITDFGAHGRARKPGHGKSKYMRVVDQIVEQINNINK